MSRTEEPPPSDPRSLEDTLHDADATAGPAGSEGTLSRYLTIERLGAGAMGVVLRAYDPRLRREVALKILHQQEDADPAAEARMLREAQSMAQLSHPNVVAIYDAETTERGVMIAMELVSGVPVDRWLEEQPRTYQEVLAVFVQAGRGLVAAHAAGLIHRDFKPANVFMGSDSDGAASRVRVGDFGLARVTGLAPTQGPASESSEVELTVAGTIMGTPVYMAPEQHLGLPADERADQFAFCVSLWEAVHGERPFEGGSVFALAYAKQNGDLKPPRTKIPRSIHAAITRGLAPDPAERWPDLATLLQHLQPPRRRWGALALGLSSTLAVTAIAFVLSTDTVSPREARCTTAQEHLARSWDEPIRARLEASSKVPRRVLKSMDAYTKQLDDQYTATCDASPPADNQQFEATMSCLDIRAQRVQTVAELLDTSPVPEGKPTDKLLDSLTPIDRCVSARTKETRELLPDDPQLRTAVLKLRDQNTRVKQLRDDGRLPEALAAADAAVARAQTLGLRPVLANALFTRSSLAKAEERYDDAATLLHRVLELRLSVGDYEGGVAAAMELVYIRGVLQDRYAEADGWAAVVRGLMGSTDIGPVRRGWFFNHTGASMNARGNPEAALEPLQRAVAELSDGLGPGHHSVSDPLSHLANALLKLERASKALEPARRALALRLEHYPEDSKAVETARLNLSKAQARTGATAGALRTLDEALGAIQSRTDTTARQGSLWEEVAEIHARAGDSAAEDAARRQAKALRTRP
ncbi:MAG: protein kinase domain-containing protein [Nannocystales bacterium]